MFKGNFRSVEISRWLFGLVRKFLNVNVKKNVNALFIVELHLAIKLVYRHPTFNNVKETIQS